MYESLLRLPYFQGMSKDNITSILEKVTIEFKRYSQDDAIFHQGEKCDKLVILIQGTIYGTRTSSDGTYSITEELLSPQAIEPYSIFGYDASFQREYKAKDECTLLTIDKQHLFGELSRHNIFIINFLSTICRRVQQQQRDVWQQTHTSIPGRIARFIARRCDSPKGEKQITIKMERLATLLCETRLNISKALNEMQSIGYLTLHRGSMTIHSLDKMLQEFD